MSKNRETKTAIEVLDIEQDSFFIYYDGRRVLKVSKIDTGQIKFTYKNDLTELVDDNVELVLHRKLSRA